VEIYNRWQSHLNIPIYQVYGSTEVGHVCYSRIDKKPKPGTIGLPLGSRECMIVDPATLDPVNQGESGELLVASPHTLKGYWNKPEETQRTCVDSSTVKFSAAWAISCARMRTANSITRNAAPT
jgi:long-chain acyl-CoA synthetase